jgi:hypothetical protein
VFLYDDVAKLDFELVNVYVGVKSEFTRAAKMYRMRLIMTDGRALGLVENYEQELDAVRDQIQAAVNRKNKYYVIAGRREKGPYTVIQLREALKNKTVTRSTLVRAEGGDEQIRLGELLR